ncbi:MAG: type II toxin-antitoxin system HicB family antitoxin [Planctomycetota bacterium]
MRQVILKPDVEDGGWTAIVPSLPGCVSDGDTKEQALANVRDAIDCWIEGAKALGHAIPADSHAVELAEV